MTEFDQVIMSFLNQPARGSRLFDGFVWLLTGNNLAKGGVMMCLVWWAWFRGHADLSRRRAALIGTLAGCLAAIVVGRGASLVLPHRHRPIHDPSVEFTRPHWVDVEALNGWSSMPSDHAVMFFAFSAGMGVVSLRLGAVAAMYSMVLIALPRMYTGLHYPSDVLVGAAIGVLIGAAFGYGATRWTAMRRGADLAGAHPEWFCPVAFLLLFQIAEMFGSSRALVSAVWEATSVLRAHANG